MAWFERPARAHHAGRDPQGSRYAALRMARGFRKVLHALQAQPDNAPGLTLGDLLALHARSPLSSLLMLLALFSTLPMGGSGNVAGMGMWWLCWNWLRGQDTVTLPRRLADWRLSKRLSETTLHWLAKGYRYSGRWMRPRWHSLQAPWTRFAWAAWIAWQAWVIFLPIPMGNYLPAFSLMALSLGRMLDDGLLLLVSLGLGVLGTLYGVALGDVTWDLVAWSWHWLQAHLH